MLRKPTMIALRARHTAFRIAGEILWGRKIHVEPPAVPPPFAMLADFDPHAVFKPRHDNMRVLAWSLVGVLVLVAVLFLAAALSG